MTAIILQFPSARVVRVIELAPPVSQRERLASLARLIGEELDKAPPRPKRRKSRQSVEGQHNG